MSIPNVAGYEHDSGGLGVCPICGKQLADTDKDVKLYRLEFVRLPLPRGLKAQHIWYRIHEHCIEEYPADCEQKLAGLYVNCEGIAIIDDSRCGQYKHHEQETTK